VASTPQHANGFIVCLGSATTALDYVVDIAIGAGGSETIICADLIACTGTGTGARIPQYVCPIPIPAGTRISARMAGSASSGTIRCSIELLSVLPGGVPPFQKMTTYGARLTGGVQVDPGASANTKGAYVPVGTVPVGQEIRGLSWGLGNRANTARSQADVRLDLNYDLGGGSAIIMADWPFVMESTGDCMVPQCPSYVIPLHLPGGGTVNARAMSNTTTSPARLFDVIVYAFS